MNFLNNDVLYYIGKFLELKDRIYFFSCISLKNQLFLIFDDIEKPIYISYLIKKHDLLNLLILKSHINIFKENLIDYCVKYYNKKILTLFLNNITTPINCYHAFIMSFKNINILKILLNYEDRILNEKKSLESVKYYEFYYLYNITKGCAINLKGFKYYLLNSQYSDKIKKTIIPRMKHIISRINNYHIYIKTNGTHSNLIYKKLDEKIIKFIRLYHMFDEIIINEKHGFKMVIEKVLNDFKNLQKKYDFFEI